MPELGFLVTGGTRGSHPPDLVSLDGELTAALRGLPLLFVRFSYGDELRLHLGELVKYQTPHGRTAEGSHGVGVAASGWRLELPGRSLTVEAPPDDDGADQDEVRAALEAGELLRPGVRVEAVAVAALFPTSRLPPALELAVRFEDGSRLVVTPDREAPDYGRPQTLHDWEVHVPGRTLLGGPLGRREWRPDGTSAGSSST